MALPKDRLKVRILPAGSPTSGPYPPLDEWEDITSFAREESGVTITGGRPNEGSDTDPGKADLTLDNRDGRFSPRNPTGPYFGVLKRNTPINIAWDVDGLGTEVPLFSGFVVAWPPRWDLSAKDSFAPIPAAGLLHVLSQGQKALKSALFRSLNDLSEVDPPLAYWPMEDGENATQIASGLVDGQPMTFDVITVTPAGTNPPDPDADLGFGSDEGPPGADGGIELPLNWVLRGTMPRTTGTAFTIETWLSATVEESGINQNTIFQIRTPGTGEVVRWNLTIQGVLQGLDSEGDVVTTHATGGAFNVTDGIHHFAVVFEQVGADTEVTQYVDGVLDFEWIVEPGITLNMPRQLRIWQHSSDENLAQYFSHIVVWPRALTTSDFALRVTTGNAYIGEVAGDRMLRLGVEEDVEVFVHGDPDLEMPMGFQRPESLLDLLRECESADGGVLFESLGQGFEYRNRHELYNQDATLALSVAEGHIAAPPEPTDDDQRLRNEVTAKRVGGSSATAVGDQTVGRFDAEVDVVVAEDGVLQSIAEWHVHLGTVDELRFPRIAINLDQNSDLIETWLAARATIGPGFRLTLNHDLAQILGVEIDQLLEGWSETIVPDQHRWTVELHTAPASPWKVGEFDSATYGRFDTAGSELAAAATDTDTSLSVATTEGPLWTTEVAEFPFDVVLGGERVTVTAVTGTSSPQTFTVTRSVNDVVKAHDAGTTLALHIPGRFAL